LASLALGQGDDGNIGGKLSMLRRGHAFQAVRGAGGGVWPDWHDATAALWRCRAQQRSNALVTEE